MRQADRIGRKEIQAVFGECQRNEALLAVYVFARSTSCLVFRNDCVAVPVKRGFGTAAMLERAASQRVVLEADVGAVLRLAVLELFRSAPSERTGTAQP